MLADCSTAFQLVASSSTEMPAHCAAQQCCSSSAVHTPQLQALRCPPVNACFVFVAGGTASCKIEGWLPTQRMYRWWTWVHAPLGVWLYTYPPAEIVPCLVGQGSMRTSARALVTAWLYNGGRLRDGARLRDGGGRRVRAPVHVHVCSTSGR